MATKGQKVFQSLLGQWSIIKEIERVLSIPFRATLKLQRYDLTMSDVFGIWIEIQIQIEKMLKKKMITNLATNLLTATIERRQLIFKNDIMICAVFLDPRYRSEIVNHKSIADSEYAIEKLVLLWNQLNQMGQKDLSVQNDMSGNTIDLDSSHDSLNELNDYLKRSTAEEHISIIPEENQDIKLLLETFDPEWISAKESVLTYWENAKESNPLLYKLAMAVYAVPPTEVQIERDFSKLDFILTSRRMRLDPKMLEAILLLHLNKDIFFALKKEELNNLKI